MVLTKEIEAEVTQVYDTWLHGYINGDVDTYEKYLDEKYRFIGSTGNEEFLSREDTAHFFRATADQLAGKTEIRNSVRTIQQLGDLVFLTDLFDAWFLNEAEWTYYGRFRFTSALQKKEDEWKFIYQHFSTPDEKAEEGQTIGYQQISAENLQLREAIKRRTKELEEKNRQLEIETSLERVRARTMAMHRSQDMEATVITLFDEVSKLGLDKSIRCGIGILEGNTDYMETYSATSNPDGTVDLKMGMLNMNIHPMLFEISQSWKAGKSDFQYYFDRKNLLIYYKALNDARDYHFERNLDSLPQEEYQRGFFFKEGILFAFASNPFSEESVSILNRFAAVFGQTYTRFLDLQKAEAQAKEAQIEAALERVRARSMAMRKSEELMDAGELVYRELSKLGIENMTAGYVLINKTESIGWNYGVNPKDGSISSDPTGIPLTDSSVMKTIFKSWKLQEPVLVIELDDAKTIAHQTYIAENATNFPLSKEELLKISPERLVIHTFNFAHGYLLIVGGKALTNEEKTMVIRFAKVFEQTYTRFLDLQKAETRAREAQIEVSLERVRAKTMAMHHTSELQDVINTVHQQLTGLNIAITGGAFIAINDEIKDDLACWGAGGTTNYVERVLIPFIDSPIYTGLVNGIKKGPGFFTETFSQQEKVEFFKYLFNNPPYNETSPKRKKEIMSRRGGYTRSCYVSKYTSIFMIDHYGEKFSEQDNEILKRFGIVFEQTYTRFLDLQKAEARAREAEIETALERIRSRTMAMQKSEELAEVSSLMFQQLKILKIDTYSSGFTIWDQEKYELTSWMCNADGSMNPPFHMPLAENTWHKGQFDAWKNEKTFLIKDFQGEEMKAQFRYLRSFPLLDEAFKKSISAGHPMPERQIHHVANFSHGNLLFITLEPKPEAHEIFKRFAKVFEQTYTRFLDLQKAEAQARESQIQLALERVRARTMAMQQSEELQEASQMLDEQVRSLGIETWGCAFHIYNQDDSDSLVWDEEWFSSQSGILTPYKTPRENIFKKYYDISKTGKKLYVQEIGHDKIYNHYKYLQSLPVIGTALKNAFENGVPIPHQQFDHVAYFKQGHLLFITYKQVPEAHDIFKRFAKVFEQAYTRFLDLQKAEAQARESEIQLALERVRARTMAMHKSEELAAVSAVLFQQLNVLGNTPERINIGIVKEEKGIIEYWATDQGGNQIDHSFNTSIEEPTTIAKVYDGWKKHIRSMVVDLKGDELNAWMRYLRKELNMPFKEELVHKRRVHTVAYFSQGMLLISTPEPVKQETINLLERFASVFNLTYRRFLDLKKAEAQARESQIEAALEKVRSRTLAMQKSEELAETSVVVFKQLIKLGIEPNRLFIGVIKGAHEIETWATNEDGTKIASRFILDTRKNDSIKEMYQGWKQKKQSITIDMKGQVLKDYFHYLAEEKHIPFKGGLSQKRRIQYVAFFSKGFIGMASPNEQPKATLELLERFAAVFNLTFTRFNDLKIAEANALKAEQDLIEIKAARKRAEKALLELQATQKQLIQSEKMASLGELTAGIAHEIKNPLNFVNNFSEVSKELLEEMNLELKNGNYELVAEIAGDVNQNLEKILHHGKRADGIVKGMLQHSRSNSGQKEDISVNSFVDEYLRLAYHGLRAKDKSFNAKMETDFDPNGGEISAVPQELGRVILNLVTNAFYAVSEKKKKEGGEYEPTVWVSTNKQKGVIEIKVRDNGTGIPKEIKEKIFQPFFTTKPTGEGTGLGLSLSYDIVKAHRGDLLVESVVGKGSTFILILKTN